MYNVRLHANILQQEKMIMIYTFRYKHVYTFTQHVHFIALDLEIHRPGDTRYNNKITSDNDQFVYFHE